MEFDRLSDEELVATVKLLAAMLLIADLARSRFAATDDRLDVVRELAGVY